MRACLGGHLEVLDRGGQRSEAITPLFTSGAESRGNTWAKEIGTLLLLTSLYLRCRESMLFLTASAPITGIEASDARKTLLGGGRRSKAITQLPCWRDVSLYQVQYKHGKIVV